MTSRLPQWRCKRSPPALPMPAAIRGRDLGKQWPPEPSSGYMLVAASQLGPGEMASAAAQ